MDKKTNSLTIANVIFLIVNIIGLIILAFWITQTRGKCLEIAARENWTLPILSLIALQRNFIFIPIFLFIIALILVMIAWPRSQLVTFIINVITLFIILIFALFYKFAIELAIRNFETIRTLSRIMSRAQRNLFPLILVVIIFIFLSRRRK